MLEFPIAFNPMEVADPKALHLHGRNPSACCAGCSIWGPRLEHPPLQWLVLLEYPDATMLDITRVLTDKDFRKDVMNHVTDPGRTYFWNVEFATWNDKFGR